MCIGCLVAVCAWVWGVVGFRFDCVSGGSVRRGQRGVCACVASHPMKYDANASRLTPCLSTIYLPPHPAKQVQRGPRGPKRDLEHAPLRALRARRGRRAPGQVPAKAPEGVGLLMDGAGEMYIHGVGWAGVLLGCCWSGRESSAPRGPGLGWVLEGGLIGLSVWSAASEFVRWGTHYSVCD